MKFKQWIKQFKNEYSAIGDLARDIVEDGKQFPNIDDHNHLLNYLHDQGACLPCVEVFEKSWIRYSLYKEIVK